MVAFDIVLWINKGSCTRFSMNWRRDEAAFNQSSHLGDCRLVLFLTSHYGNFEFIPKQNCIMNPCAQHLALTINNSCPCHFTLTPSLHCMEASPQQNIIVSTPICTFKNFFKKSRQCSIWKKNLSSLILWNTKLSHRYIRAFAACCPNSLKSGSVKSMLGLYTSYSIVFFLRLFLLCNLFLENLTLKYFLPLLEIKPCII